MCAYPLLAALPNLLTKKSTYALADTVYFLLWRTVIALIQPTDLLLVAMNFCGLQ